MSTEEHVPKQCTEFTMIVSGPLHDPEDDEIEQERRMKISGNLVLPEKLFPISGVNALLFLDLLPSLFAAVLEDSWRYLRSTPRFA